MADDKLQEAKTKESERAQIQDRDGLLEFARQASAALGRVVERYQPLVSLQETGRVVNVSRGVARVRGLPTAKAEEVIYTQSGIPGMVFNLDPGEIGIILLGESGALRSGEKVYRSGRVQDVPVGDALLGRVIDAAGNPLDGRGPIRSETRLPIERDAPEIMDRHPVRRPLQTGIKVIDALLPIGRGQRELILGDRQTGKTAIALDTIINQKGRDVLCIYCATGQRDAAVARLIADLREYDAMPYSIVLVASGSEPPGKIFVAPYAATSIAEHFMEQGRDVLIVYDDLTQHARAYREVSLLLRRPPGREAYPGDIFYIHSRLLERATQLSEEKGGGSLTALPIIETQAQNISAYIPTNLISITDGQIYLSPELFQRGILPAVDVGRSVSRVGGKAQLPAYNEVAGDLRLSYSQYQELEVFARFGTHLEEETQRQLERGRRVREVLKQSQYQPIPVPEQIGVLFAVTNGLFDDLAVEEVAEASQIVREVVREELHEVSDRISEGEELEDRDREALQDALARGLGRLHRDDGGLQSP